MCRAGVKAYTASNAFVFIYYMAAALCTGDGFLYRAYLDTFTAPVAFGVDVCFWPCLYQSPQPALIQSVAR